MHSPGPEFPRLSFVGGTGPEGRGLVLRLARAGFPVYVGSRSTERGQTAAEEARRSLPNALIEGGANFDAARHGDIVLLTIPYAGLAETLPPLRSGCEGKIVVSVIAPIEFRDGRPFALAVEAGSAAQDVQRLLPESRVVSAFQTVDSHQLQDLDAVLDTDVVVCSDDAGARRELMRITGALDGLRPLSGGRLAASRYVEECTALLITINRIYKTHSGIRITNVNR